jgi:signal peptidase I
VGNAHQLSRTVGVPAHARHRVALYAAGTVSMLVLSMTASLGLWIGLPWGLLGWSPTLIVSGSMEPLVSAGDVVMVRPVPTDELGTDTVVLYERPETGRVLHRIVAVLPDGSFRTQGDANDVADSAPVRPDDVRGVAVLAVPWVGRPSLWLRDGEQLPLAATGATLLLLLGLAPRAVDPAFDPWGSAQRVNPAEVLLGRTGRTAADRRTDGGSRLLAEDLHDLVHARLAGQSAAVSHRTTHLLEGLS